jgi:hypothetical protein
MRGIYTVARPVQSILIERERSEMGTHMGSEKGDGPDGMTTDKSSPPATETCGQYAVLEQETRKRGAPRPLHAHVALSKPTSNNVAGRGGGMKVKMGPRPILFGAESHAPLTNRK